MPNYVEVLQATREAVDTLTINTEKLNEIGGFLTGVIFSFLRFSFFVSSLFNSNFGNFLLCSSRCRTVRTRRKMRPY